MPTIPLPIVSKRDVHRALLADGWVDVSRPRSDHFMLEHPARPGRRIRLSHGTKPLTKPVINHIIEQGGYTRESFAELLGRT
jgi:predicted RNA binding protein YcfA (HicA-like mRNA interferase family)